MWIKSDDEVDDETFSVEHHQGKGLAQKEDSDDEEEVLGDIYGNDGEEEEEDDDSEDEEELCFPTIRKPVGPATRRVVDNSVGGMTKEVKRLRKIDPYIRDKTTSDYRFYNAFQQDFYEIVILSDRNIIVEAQWMEWNHMERANVPLFNEIIGVCAERKIKKLMGFKKH